MLIVKLSGNNKDYIHSKLSGKYFQLFIFLNLLFITIVNTQILFAQKGKQQRIQIPSTNMSFIPPPGFRIVGSSSILVNETNDAAFNIQELSSPFAEVVMQYLDARWLKEEKIEVISSPQEIIIDSANGLRFNFRKNAGLLTSKGVFLQVYVVGDTAGSLVVIATYESTIDDKAVEKILASISTIHWDRTKTVRPGEFLNFTYEMKGDFKPYNSGSNWDVYTSDGGPLDTVVVKPAFLLRTFPAPGIPLPENQLQEIMESMLQNVHPFVRISNVLEFNKVTVDGIRGFETVSFGHWTSNDSTLAVYYTVLFHPIQYIAMTGFSSTSEKDRYVELFKETVRTFKRKKVSTEEHSECNTLLAARKYPQAVNCFEALLKSNPTLLSAALGKANAFRLQNKHTEAIKEYERIIDQNGTIEEAYLGRARSYTKLKKYPEAKIDFDKAIDLNSNNIAALIERAKIRKEYHDFNGALNDFDLAITLAPDSSDFYVMRAEVLSSEEAIKSYTKALSLSKKNASAYKGRGEIYMATRRYEKALDDFTRAIALNPKNLEIYRLRGYAYSFLGNHEAAIKDLELGVTENTTDPKAWYMRGWVYGLDRKIDLAMKDYSRSVALDSSDWVIYLHRGITHFFNRKYRDASVDLRKAAEISFSAEARSWVYFSEFKAYGSMEATKYLERHGKLASEDWYPIVKFLLGELTEEQLIRGAEKPHENETGDLARLKRQERMSDVYFAIGMKNYITGLKSTAKKHWKMCLDTKAGSILSYQIAYAYMAGKYKE